MNLAIARLRYTQFFVVALLAISLHITIQSLPEGPSQFANNLWEHEFLLTHFSKLKLKLGDRVFSNAVVGKDGWLDYTGFGNLDGYQNVTQTSPAKLQDTQKTLQKFYQELKKRNITLILVVAPNKATIYSDKLPDEIQKLNPHSKLDLFAAHLQKHGPPVLVDLRLALQERRKNQDVYYKTDTHWNGYGAFIAYREIVKELSKNYPQLAPKKMDDFKIKISTSVPHDIARITSLSDLRESWISITPKQNNAGSTSIAVSEDMTVSLQDAPKKDTLTLLMYKDSFGRRINDFLLPHFSKVTVIELYPKYPKLLSLKAIDIIKPDIVIVEMVERSFNLGALELFLQKMLPQN